MSSNTTNLNLYKADTVADGLNTFNIKTMLNDNWDKVDGAVSAKEPTISTKNSAFNQSFETSTSNIKMDGVVSVGASANVARADHVHASDTSKANLASPTFTGVPLAPTPATTDNSTKIATTAFINALLGSVASNLVFTNNALAFRGITGTMADSDQWRIGGAGTASDSGYLEIATADNGTEPIYVRQYANAFTSPARTLTLLDANGDTTIPNNLTVGSGSPFILAKNGCPASANNAHGALGQWYEGVGVQGYANAGASSSYIFSVLTNDQAYYLNVFNGGKVTTKNNTLDDGSGNMNTGGITASGVGITGGGDSILSLTTTGSATTTYRQKRIYSSPNVGGGSTWLFRATRPSDGANIDYNLGTGTESPGAGGAICTTLNEPSSLGTNGYKKFADGTIIQWGQASVVAGTGCLITLPIAFPVGCLMAMSTPNNSSSSATSQAYNITTTTITVMCNATGGLFWFAIGR